MSGSVFKGLKSKGAGAVKRWAKKPLLLVDKDELHVTMLFSLELSQGREYMFFNDLEFTINKYIVSHDDEYWLEKSG